MKNLLNQFTNGDKELQGCSMESIEEIYINLDSNNEFDHELYEKTELILTQGVRALPEIELDLQFILKDGIIPKTELEGILYIKDNFFYFIKSLPLNIVFSKDLRYYTLNWLDDLNKNSIITDYTVNNIDFSFEYPNEVR